MSNKNNLNILVVNHDIVGAKARLIADEKHVWDFASVELNREPFPIP